MSSSSASVDSDLVKLDITGLAKDWDSKKNIRDHLRQEGNVLFADGVSESVKSSSVPYVHDLLEPVLKRMVETDGRPQPSIDGLKDEVTTLYQKCSCVPDESTIAQDAWTLRKFLSFVKMKTRTKKVSTVPYLNLNVF